MTNGIYQSIKPHTVFEEHGGATIGHQVYWNVCVYDEGKIGFFGGSKNYLVPFYDKSFQLKGEILHETDDNVEFFVTNPFTKYRKIFKGKFVGGKLYLKSYLENNPNEIDEDVLQRLEVSL